MDELIVAALALLCAWSPKGVCRGPLKRLALYTRLGNWDARGVPGVKVKLLGRTPRTPNA